MRKINVGADGLKGRGQNGSYQRKPKLTTAEYSIETINICA
jgi:hypothetical protein